MTHVKQTIFGEKGNCFSACVASIFELPIEVVPNFVGDFEEQWLGRFNRWLSLVKPGVGAMLLESGQFYPPGMAILSARVAEAERRHCVVVVDGKIAWDPSPSPRELLDDRWWVVLVLLDPVK